MNEARLGDGPMIEVRGLRKSYGDLEAVAGVSFSVARGEVFGILGPNGAGKTTTVEILEGMRPPDGGAAFVNGIDVRSDPSGSSRSSECSSSPRSSSRSSTCPRY